MDLTYATIPMFGRETKRLYRENKLAYIISNEKNSINHPIYQQPKEVTTLVWSMFFDGAITQASAGAGVVLISSSRETIHLSYKLDFKTTNNIEEYESLLLGLKAAKEMGIMCLKIFGDADLIIHQVNNTFQAKNIRLKAYRDEVWKLRDSFMFFELSYIPRAMNHLVDSLVVSASLFVPPLPPKLSYDIQVKYRPSLPDNVKFGRCLRMMMILVNSSR